MTDLLYRPRRRAINLTALIDVVFILLMFFMLTSSFQQWGTLSLQPVVSSPSEAPSEPLLVTLSEHGALALNGQGRRLADFRLLDSQHQDWFDPQQAVIVLPEAAVPVQDVIELLDRIRSLGVPSVNYGGVVRLGDADGASQP
ncbi:ExbD/TolR family protein [Ketobacter sp.]|uniref:ExbD/TolR family protein n=1 Tax=Ketobacter sp. TaxID=2083498 RepID=UPI000F158FAE|nr:biopolymer transporter ExbD [Ketobacter sp.]RLU00622.1 MAG: biopolymer transporter ExbD [Ketobacter sp.]